MQLHENHDKQRAGENGAGTSAMLTDCGAQTIAQWVAVDGVVTAPRALPEFHARELQLAGKLDKKQIACRDLLRRFSWSAHGPQATRHHAQNACLLAHGFPFASCSEELLARVEQQRVSVLSTHFQECAAPPAPEAAAASA